VYIAKNIGEAYIVSPPEFILVRDEIPIRWTGSAPRFSPGLLNSDF